MKTQVDLQTLLGFGSATSLPVIFHAMISFVHPALYTLTCGQGYVDGVAACYHNQVAEAILWLVLSAGALIYGFLTLRARLFANPTPTNSIQLVDRVTGATVSVRTVEAPVPAKEPDAAASSPAAPAEGNP